MRIGLSLALAAACGTFGLAGCGEPEGYQAPTTPVGAAPTSPGENAAGMVGVDDAGAAETPTTPALPGGPAGQTPDWGEPAGAPSVVYSPKDGAGPSVSSDDPPL